MNNLNLSDVIKFYSNHSIGDTANKFNISYYLLRKYLIDNNVNLHSASENAKLNNINHGNGFANKLDKDFDKLLTQIDKDEFEAFYRSNGKADTLSFFNITSAQFNRLLKYYNISKLSSTETKNINYIKKYGSIEEGKLATTQKAVSHTDYASIRTKITATNNIKYGGSSPFCSSEVRSKSKQTCLDKYGVDNVFKDKQVQMIAHEHQKSKYGGIGWQSDELRQKYISTMQDRYGVDWGCLLPQCIDKCNGSLSKPNLLFANILTENNIEYATEFVIDNYKYDFKIGNILIEINPTATHNTIWNPFTSKCIDELYHYNKSECARNHGFRCIHIWDWDNIDKILLLLNNRKTIYARKCELREVDKSEAKQFINMNHIQGYINDTVRIGLYYNDELVSIMTFGKPRYNKKFEWELLRYCSNSNVIGGASKIFKYFTNNYLTSSIISYCDLSKFTGTVYEQLGFTYKSCSRGKHWYNIKTNKHITDNLLRQRGFDQLFSTNYGKGTSNETLMLENGFVTVYDAGQATYTYIKYNT